MRSEGSNSPEDVWEAAYDRGDFVPANVKAYIRQRRRREEQEKKGGYLSEWQAIYEEASPLGDVFEDRNAEPYQMAGSGPLRSDEELEDDPVMALYGGRSSNAPSSSPFAPVNVRGQQLFDAPSPSPFDTLPLPSPFDMPLPGAGSGAPPDLPEEPLPLFLPEDEGFSGSSSSSPRREMYWQRGGLFSPYDLTETQRGGFLGELEKTAKLLGEAGVQAITPARATATGRHGGVLQWDDWRTRGGQYKVKATASFSTWQGLPTVFGNIITPTLLIPSDEEKSPRLMSPPEVVASFMSGSRQHALNWLEKQEGALPDLLPKAERLAQASVRNEAGYYASLDASWRTGWPRALQVATAGAINLRLQDTTSYAPEPRELYRSLRKMKDQGLLDEYYFVRKPYPSKDPYHPERATWPAYRMSSLQALGYKREEIPEQPGEYRYIMDTDKPVKRRQLGVQIRHLPAGQLSKLRRGRMTGDRATIQDTLFLENYPYAEGTGILHPDVVPQGFWSFKSLNIKRPGNIDPADWSINFAKRQLGKAGAPLELGYQTIEDQISALTPQPGRRGMRQTVWDWAELPKGRGYEVLIGQLLPASSGSFKSMAYGQKALQTISAQRIEEIRAANPSFAGVQSAQPLPKSWQQTAYGMYDILPEKELLGMGLTQAQVRGGEFTDEVRDTLIRHIQSQRTEHLVSLEMSRARLEAFMEQGVVEDWQPLTQRDDDRVQATIRQAGYHIQAPFAARLERPGKQPFYSMEEVGYLLRKETEVYGANPREMAQLRKRLVGSSPASRIYGVATAMPKDLPVRGMVDVADLPWGIAQGQAESTEDLMKILGDLMHAKEQRVIQAPGGVLLPNPRDVLSHSARDTLGKEQSRFVRRYTDMLIAARDMPEDYDQIVSRYQESMEELRKSPTMRRKAMGRTLRRAFEGPYVGDMGIPDEYLVAGDAALANLAGISPRHTKRLAQLKEALAGGQEFLAAGTRRPISDVSRQFEQVLNVVTPEMAQARWGVELEDLGDSYAVSTMTAAVWRGDFDADRAIVRALTQAKWGQRRKRGEDVAGQFAKGPGRWGFFTPARYQPHAQEGQQVRNLLAALQEIEPQAVVDWRERATGMTLEDRKLIENRPNAAQWEAEQGEGPPIDAKSMLLYALADLDPKAKGYWKKQAKSLGLFTAADRALKPTAPMMPINRELIAQTFNVGELFDQAIAGGSGSLMTAAMSRAAYGIQASWNEAAKWSEELKPQHWSSRIGKGGGPITEPDWLRMKNAPLTLAQLREADAQGIRKYAWTERELMDQFQGFAEAKSQMGPIYNRLIRNLTALAETPEQERAANTLAAQLYQGAVDMGTMGKPAGTLFELMTNLGPSGFRYRRYTEREGGEAFVNAATGGGLPGLLSELAYATQELPIPDEMKGVLFSSDPAIAETFSKGGAYKTLTQHLRGGTIRESERFFSEEKTGPLTRLVLDMMYSKGSFSRMKQTGWQQERAQEGRGLRAQVSLLSKFNLGQKDLVQLAQEAKGRPEFRELLRLNFQRMGLDPDLVEGDEDIASILKQLPSFANASLPGRETLAYISSREADVLEGLRSGMPASQAAQIAQAISKPARYTPKGETTEGIPSFAPSVGNDWESYIEHLQSQRPRAMRSLLAWLRGAEPKEQQAMATEALTRWQNRPLGAVVSDAPVAVQPSTQPLTQSPVQLPAQSPAKHIRASLLNWDPATLEGQAGLLMNLVEQQLPAELRPQYPSAEAGTMVHEALQKIIKQEGYLGEQDWTTEEAMTGEIGGIPVQGHADLLARKRGLLFDIKPEGDPNRYRYQLAAYQTLSGARAAAIIPYSQQLRNEGKIEEAARQAYERETQQMPAPVSQEDLAARVRGVASFMEANRAQAGEIARQIEAGQLKPPERFSEALDWYGSGLVQNVTPGVAGPAREGVGSLSREQKAAQQLIAGDEAVVTHDMIQQGFAANQFFLELGTSMQEQFGLHGMDVKARAAHYGPGRMTATYSIRPGGGELTRYQQESVLNAMELVANQGISGTALQTLGNIQRAPGLGQTIQRQIRTIAQPLARTEREAWTQWEDIEDLIGKLGSAEDLPEQWQERREALQQVLAGGGMAPGQEGYERVQIASHAITPLRNLQFKMAAQETGRLIGMGAGKEADLVRKIAGGYTPGIENATPKQQVAAYNAAIEAAQTLRTSVEEQGLNPRATREVYADLQPKLIDAMERLYSGIEEQTKATGSLTYQQQQLNDYQREALRLTKDQIGESSGYRAGIGEIREAVGRYRRGEQIGLDEAELKRLRTVRGLYSWRSGREGPPAMDEMLAVAEQEQATQSALESLGDQREPRNWHERLNQMWQGGAQQRRNEAGQFFYGGLGALGFGMFNIQRWWRFTGGALMDWEREYAGQQLTSQQAAFAAGISGTNAPSGMPEDIFSRQAATANLRWRLGESSARTWGPWVTGATTMLNNMPDWTVDVATQGLGLLGLTGVGQLGTRVASSMLGLPGLMNLSPISLARQAAGALTTAAPNLLGGATLNALGSTLVPPLAFAAVVNAASRGPEPPAAAQVATKTPMLVDAYERAAQAGLIAEEGISPTEAARRYPPANTTMFQMQQGVPYQVGSPIKRGVLDWAGSYTTSNVDAWRDFYDFVSKQNLPSVAHGATTIDQQVQRILGEREKQGRVDLSREELTIVARNVNMILGDQASDKLIVTTTERARMFPQGAGEQMQFYGRALQQMGAYAGAPGMAKILESLATMEYPELNRMEIAMGFAGTVGIGKGWMPGEIYSQAQLVQGMLNQGVPVGTAQLRYQLETGTAGLGTALGYNGGASTFIEQALNRNAPALTPSARDNILRAINPQLYQYMNAGQIAGATRGMVQRNDLMTMLNVPAFATGRMEEMNTQGSAWGYSANQGFGQGSLTDYYGRTYGQYSPWFDNSGNLRQSLFSGQQTAGWAGLNLGVASEEVRQARFERSQAQQREEWGGGPFISTNRVMASKVQEYRDWQASLEGMSPADQAAAQEAGFQFSGQIGGSQIGLVQQEAAIRRQMWSENLNYQQQQIEFARQSLQLAIEQYEVQREQRIEERDAQRTMQLQQREWKQEDFTIQGQRMGITQGWAMEDIERNIRFSMGRERIQLMRQRDRMMMQQGWEQEDFGRSQSRQGVVWQYEDDRYNRAVENEQKLYELQQRSFGLQAAQLAAQESHLAAQAGMQRELHKIEDKRLETQYQDIQAQMKEEKRLEELRQTKNAADLNLMALQLEHAEMMEKNLLDWLAITQQTWSWLQMIMSIVSGAGGGAAGGGAGGSAGGGTAGGGAAGGGAGGGSSGGQHLPEGTSIMPAPRVPIEATLPVNFGQDMVTQNSPTVVQFILDGDVIMEAVVTPDRLRPVIKVVQERDKWR